MHEHTLLAKNAFAASEAARKVFKRTGGMNKDTNTDKIE
jgi:hypothetical protein